MNILVFSDLNGQMDNLESLMEKSREFSLEAVCCCGNIVDGQARSQEWQEAQRQSRTPNRNRLEILEEALEDLRDYRTFCAAVDGLGVPVAVIPGDHDAPEERYFTYMQQAAFHSDNIILVHEAIGKVGSLAVAGFGGQISAADKEDYFFLQYPREEFLFGTRRMHFMQPAPTLLLHTPPVSTLDMQEGRHLGSTLVNDLIAAVAPAFVFCGHVPAAAGSEVIGDALVVNPGSLSRGQYALVDTAARTARLFTL